MKSLALKTIIVLILTVLLSQSAFATRYHVKDTGGSDNNNGLSWDYAFKTIQKGIDTASSGDDIWVMGYYDSTAYDITVAIDVNKAVNLYGGFHMGEDEPADRDSDQVSIIDADNNCRCFNVTADATIDGFELLDGNAENGGGMYVYDCAPKIVGCAFISNYASADGGGIYAEDIFEGTMEVINCLFYYNFAYHYGGGMYNVYAEPEIVNCTFYQNTGYENGGAICNDSDNSTMINCILWYNSSEEGVGKEIFNYDSGSMYVSYSCIYGGLNGDYCDGDSTDDGDNTGNSPSFRSGDVNGNDNRYLSGDDGLVPTGSSIVDRGDNSAISETFDIVPLHLRKVDGDGTPGAVVDMGCYENQDD